MKSFEVAGTTKPFKGDGRKLGYPTANIEIPTETKEGLFFGHVTFGGKTYQAIIFIGAPVTMGDTKKRAEAHLLDHEDIDLYDTQMVFTAEYKFRDNRLFESKEKLIEQMKLDEAEARKFFAQ